MGSRIEGQGSAQKGVMDWSLGDLPPGQRLLSGLLTRGLCEAILDARVDSDACTIVLSEHILDEFARHAGGKLRIRDADVQAALKFLGHNCEIVTPALMPADACPDAGDRPVLGTAIAARADALVTGDAEAAGAHERARYSDFVAARLLRADVLSNGGSTFVASRSSITACAAG